MDRDLERLTRLLRLAEVRRDLLAVATVGSQLRRISLSAPEPATRRRESTNRRAA